MAESGVTVEQRTGQLYGDLWPQYDDKLFRESLDLFAKRWQANGEDPEFFHGKRCLDAGCGGGRYSLAMSQMGAASVMGVDVSESGLEDARRRGQRLGFSNVTFQQASVLDLPFSDADFDFVCCSGVLHHTSAVERGFREIYRVLKPGGSVYILLYGAGGVFWPLNYLMRALAGVLGKNEIEQYVAQAGYSASKRRAVVDDLFVPILETYSGERVASLLRNAGFGPVRIWQGDRMDHETDAASMLAELETRCRLWEAGADASSDAATAKIAWHGAAISSAVIAAVRFLTEQHAAGQISKQMLRDAVIGHGHHRLIAVK
ncbi:MAG: methyltransferase domain-containing protein [Acidobacteriia bacterium]|nr:methyltransferase domain-containing protein [Terriglobia bacterium]